MIKELLCILLLNFSFDVCAQCIDCTSSNSLNTGLVWCHPFNNNAVDASGHGYNGTANNITYTLDRFSNPNSAASFNGTNSNITISQLIPDLTTFSFSFWIKPNTNSASQGYVFWEGNSLCGNDLTIRFYNNKIYFGANKSGALLDGSVARGEVSFPTTPVNNWWHVVWIMSGASSQVYLNGTLAATLAFSGSGVGSHFTPTYGAFNDGNTAPCGSPLSVFYSGLIDDSRLYNRTLTSTEVNQLYTSPIGSIDVNAGIDQTICLGDSIHLNAVSVGATSFSWSPITGLSNSAIATPYAKPVVTTNYIITTSNGICTAKDTINITVLPALTANAGSDQTICLRDSIQLNALSVGATSFLWSPVTGLSNSAIATPYAKPVVNTNYIVTASNGSCTAKDTVLITVNNVQVNAGTDQTICLGDSVQLNASSVSTGTYLWSPVTDLSDPNISNPKAKPGSLTQYIVSLTSGSCTAKDTVQINTANIILNAGTDKVICLGDSIKLNATCTGSANFLWSPSVILDNSNIIQPWAKPPATINLIITATNGLCVKKDTVNLSVVSRPAVSAGLDKTICPGDSVQLITTNTGAISFAWSPKISLSDSTISDPFAKPINSTNYILKVSNGICTSSDTVKVNIINPLSVNAGNDRTICKDDTVHLYASPNGASSYNWSPATGLSNNSIQSPVAMPAVSTLYKVIVANGSCTSTDSVFITVTDLHANAGPDLFVCKKDLIMVYGSGNGTGFSWNPTLYMSNNTSATPSINPDTTLSYILTVTNGTCTDRDTMKAFVTSIDAAIFIPDTAICNGDSVQLRSFINGDAFYWSPKLFISDTAAPFPFVYPNVKTKYFLTTTRGTCIKKDSITIDLTTLLFTGGAGNDTMVCKGNSLQLKANVLPGAKYLWSPTTYLSDSGISNPIAIPNATTQYILKIQTGKNCIAFDTILILVNPVPAVDAGPDQHICDENYATIGFSSSLADSFLWSPQSGLKDAGILQTQASPGINSAYIIKAMNKLTGCFSMDTVNVSYIKPKALFSATPILGNLPLPVQFYNNSNALADSFYWDFGDTISTSTARDPSHVFKKEGVYKVKLIAINKLGCYDTAEITITVIGGLIVFVPNVFTPNNDGLNEEFIISYNKDALLFLKGSIWNRWGAKVYDFEMPNGKWWNGKSEDEDCADGVYFYMFEAGDLTGKTEQFHGTLTLLR